MLGIHETFTEKNTFSQDQIKTIIFLSANSGFKVHWSIFSEN